MHDRSPRHEVGVPRLVLRAVVAEQSPDVDDGHPGVEGEGQVAGCLEGSLGGRGLIADHEEAPHLGPTMSRLSWDDQHRHRDLGEELRQGQVHRDRRTAEQRVVDDDEIRIVPFGDRRQADARLAVVRNDPEGGPVSPKDRQRLGCEGDVTGDWSCARGRPVTRAGVLNHQNRGTGQSGHQSGPSQGVGWPLRRPASRKENTRTPHQ